MEAYQILMLFIGGLILGISHAFEPDHIAAVSNFVTRSKTFKHSATLGLFWGSGHTFTLMLFGILILVFKMTIPDSINHFFEIFLGIFLFGLGLWMIKDFIRKKTHIHIHEHDGSQHLHFHSHLESDEHNHDHKVFLIGSIHGLAGTSSLMLVVVSTIGSVKLGIVYITLFGIGSMLGMIAFSILLWSFFKFSFKSFPNISRTSNFITAIFTMVIATQILFF